MITVKKNPRNVVIVTPFVVLKYRRDWNLRKIFWEFVLTWKAFLHGVSDIPILFGPVLVRKTTNGTTLAKADLERHIEAVIAAAAELSKAGIDHKEIRHPQYHMIVQDDGRVKIIDYERGKLTGKPRNLSRLSAWLLERGTNPKYLEEIIKKQDVPENDRWGALKSVEYHKKISGK